jgi:hypothetical protein
LRKAPKKTGGGLCPKPPPVKMGPSELFFGQLGQNFLVLENALLIDLKVGLVGLSFLFADHFYLIRFRCHTPASPLHTFLTNAITRFMNYEVRIFIKKTVGSSIIAAPKNAMGIRARPSETVPYPILCETAAPNGSGVQ